MEENINEKYDELSEEFSRKELMELAKEIVIMESVVNKEANLERELSNIHSALIDYEVSRGILEYIKDRSVYE